VVFLSIQRDTRVSDIASFLQTMPWSEPKPSSFDLKATKPRMW
jgi:hypothetical protein